MEDSDENLIKAVSHYQSGLERYMQRQDEAKMLHNLGRLFKLPIKVCHLERTGVGRTVNSLRKLDGVVGDAAKSLVAKWKEMVMKEEEKQAAVPSQDEGYEEVPDDDEEVVEKESPKDSPNLNCKNKRKSKNKSDSEEDLKENRIEKHKKRSRHSSEEDEDVESTQTPLESDDRNHREKKNHEKHKDRHKSGKHSKEKSKHKNEDDEDDERDSRKRKSNHKHDKNESGDRKKHKHKSSHERSESKKSKEDDDRKAEKKHEFSEHDKKKKSHNRDKEEKEDKQERHKKSKTNEKTERDTSNSSKTDNSSGKKEKGKTKKKKNESLSSSSTSVVIDGIGSGSGTSFADALGMCGPPLKKKKTMAQPDLIPEDSQDSEENNSIEFPMPKEPPENFDISTLLPPITPNYRPLGLPINDQPKKILTDDEALSRVMMNKNQRTKVFSGNKIAWGKVPSLFELCIRVLQDNIDALEYTGGVPYSILKPILEKCNANQLYMMEHHNPYLIDDTDELWNLHCQKEFRNKARQELETWRDMYMRCLDEREAKLRALTANIKQAQDKSLPVRTTKLAYVDSVAKPPRNVARKQAKNCTTDVRPSASAKLVSIATKGEASKIAVPNPGARAAERSSSGSSHHSVKPKKAPLMAKTLSLFKNRFRR